MKAILVGAGGMGETWAKNLREHNIHTAAWVDIRPQVAREAAQKLQLSPEYIGASVSEAIQKVGGDFVVDVTIPEAHCEVTVTALEAGLPVLGEKPMASSMEEARRMVAASEKSGKLYMVSQSRRYIRRQHAFRQLIQDRLGSLGILNADFYIGAHFGGFRDEMPSPLLLDMAIHTFDQARFLTGADPVAVYAEEFNPSWSWYRGDVSATAIFEMTGGLRFTYRGSWCAEGLHTSWDADWRVVGENGTAEWEKGGVPHAQIVTSTGGFHSETEDVVGGEGAGREGITGSLEEFLAAIKGGPTPNGECHDNIKSLAMVFAAIESSRLRQRIPVEL
jgi:predicted dehydrogenase